MILCRSAHSGVLEETLYGNLIVISHSVTRCRGVREEAPSTSASMGEAPPAPGLSRRPPKQADQQDAQVIAFNCAALSCTQGSAQGRRAIEGSAIGIL